jgi:hypothetical protein
MLENHKKENEQKKVIGAYWFVNPFISCFDILAVEIIRKFSILNFVYFDRFKLFIEGLDCLGTIVKTNSLFLTVSIQDIQMFEYKRCIMNFGIN